MPGHLIYEGFNRSGTGEIAVIATTGSSNRKTGDMVQVWILPRHTLPTEACKSGDDALVCGDCPLRPALGGGCYVNVGQAPNSVWRAYQRGSYPAIDWDVPPKVPVRIGAYGDVAEIPRHVVSFLVSWAGDKGHTCYTAQWRVRPDLKSISMASVQDDESARAAQMMGWKTFRVAPVGQAKQSNDTYYFSAVEVMCPATRKGRKVTCASCTMCDAQSLNIYVEAHGPSASKVHNKEEK